MGLEHLHTVREWATLAAQELDAGSPVCVVARANELLDPALRGEEIERFRERLLQGAHSLFLYGFSGVSEENSLLIKLTNGTVMVRRRLGDTPRTYGMNFMCKRSGQRFEGIEYHADERTQAVVFDLCETREDLDVLMTAEGKPYFIKMALNESTVYIAGCNQIADIDAGVSEDVPRMAFFSAVAPLMIFLRDAFGDRCWHNPSPRACFIVDDPLLNMDYGFINYEALLSAMQQQSMCASVAFIPWNYRKTKEDVARLFRSHPESYSLSIHGCDHTWGEFGGDNETDLAEKSFRVYERMALHRRLTGIPYDNVMVFPQGIFSATAMKVLKSAGYLAAVNSTPYSVEPEKNILTLAELLDVAVLRYSNFPLFVRRYPADLPEAAFDLFLGRPVLIVEHHTYFRDGYGQMVELADKIRHIAAQLEWKSLAEICTSACMMRTAQNGEIHVKYYTAQFRIKNVTGKNMTYLLSRPVNSDEATKARVTLNGQSAAPEQSDGSIHIRLSLNAGKKAEIRVETGISKSRRNSHEDSLFRNSHVCLRRQLSEFRDNYVAKSEVLSKVWKGIRNLF